MLIIVYAMVIEGIHFDILANLRDSIAMSIQNISKIILSVSLLATASVASAASAWPSTSSGSVIATAGVQLVAGYEPSGATWDDTNNYLYIVHDEGVLSRLNSSGTVLKNWPTTGDYNADFEGVTVTDVNSNIYVANEDDNSIYEFTSSTGSTMPTKKWSFADPDWTTSQTMTNTHDNNDGLEGIAYIPAGHWYDYGVFLGLHQDTGTIYIGRPDLNTSENFTYVSKFTPLSGTSHPADLFYSVTEQRLYVLYDDGYVRVLDEDVLTNSADFIIDYTLPTSGQEEGFAIQTDASSNLVNVFIGLDNTGSVWKYTNFPQTYDNDRDGVASTADCNDSNSTVSSYLTVYQDYDGDGLGNSAVSQQVCSLTAPAGYVTNASDSDDSGIVVVPPVETTPTEPEPTPDPIETTPTEPIYSVIEYLNNNIDDDGDGSIDEWNSLANNGAHPTYSSYNANSKTLYKQVVISIAGATNGAIKVKFLDGSGYRYNVLAKGNTSVTSQNGTAYLLVRAGKKYALVNAYTGEVLDSLRTTGSVKVHLKTLSLRRK